MSSGEGPLTGFTITPGSVLGAAVGCSVGAGSSGSRPHPANRARQRERMRSRERIMRKAPLGLCFVSFGMAVLPLKTDCPVRQGGYYYISRMTRRQHPMLQSSKMSFPLRNLPV